jgi:hypothetical protein
MYPIPVVIRGMGGGGGCVEDYTKIDLREFLLREATTA